MTIEDAIDVLWCQFKLCMSDRYADQAMHLDNLLYSGKREEALRKAEAYGFRNVR